jgi:hypothetical protein
MAVIIAVLNLVPEASPIRHSRFFLGCLTPGLGSAITYIPISINLPDHFRQLKERQALYADTEAWWLCDPEPQKIGFDVATPGFTPPLHSHPSHPVTFVQASPNLQHELQSAIDTPLVPSAWLSGELPLPKTSDTHPIR